jgi:hypothetical protein
LPPLAMPSCPWRPWLRRPWLPSCRLFLVRRRTVSQSHSSWCSRGL